MRRRPAATSGTAYIMSAPATPTASPDVASAANAVSCTRTHITMPSRTHAPAITIASTTIHFTVISMHLLVPVTLYPVCPAHNRWTRGMALLGPGGSSGPPPDASPWRKRSRRTDRRPPGGWGEPGAELGDGASGPPDATVSLQSASKSSLDPSSGDAVGSDATSPARVGAGAPPGPRLPRCRRPARPQIARTLTRRRALRTVAPAHRQQNPRRTDVHETTLWR